MTVKQMNEIRGQEFRPGDGLLEAVIGGFYGPCGIPAWGNFHRQDRDQNWWTAVLKTLISTRAKREHTVGYMESPVVITMSSDLKLDRIFPDVRLCLQNKSNNQGRQ